MEIINGGVTAAKGFQATGGAVGIKIDIADMAFLASDVPATAAAAFTTNVVKAASVQRNIEIMAKKGKIKGVVMNSGNANACTGEAGNVANHEMAAAFAAALNVPSEMIMTASTGVIGSPFPIDIVKKGISSLAVKLGHSKEDGTLAAQGIMTTDTLKKEVAITLIIGGKTVTIGGMAKGSGMIHPNMATMLAFVTTDVAISSLLLDKALKACIDTTYNMVSIDGDTSTNDTIIVLANGMAENEEIVTENADYKAFAEALYVVNEKLSKLLVKDGEGATKFIAAEVSGAVDEQSAKVIAKAVITSSLVKTAMFGEDANWGRVLCAMGYSGVTFDPSKVDIAFESTKGNIKLMDKGTPIVFDEGKAAAILKEDEITIWIQLQEGSGKATAWGCDLTYDYVKINGDYRS